MSAIENIGTLFNPKGVVVVGASTHPGKFGFVALHNILSSGFTGPVFATNPNKPEILGIQTLERIQDVPSGEADFAMICISPDKIIKALPELAKIGITSAFVVSGGFKETGEKGEALEKQLIAKAQECGVIIAGPNGQGLVSTPVNLCSQIVSPYPPTGDISIASQSGNFQLNVMLPVIAYNLLKSITLMSNSMPLLANKAIKTFKVNKKNIAESLGMNPILVTALNREIGYEKAAHVAKKAYKEKRSIVDVAHEETGLPLKRLKILLNPEKLIKGGL